MSPSLSAELVWPPPGLGRCLPPIAFSSTATSEPLTDWLLGRKDIAGFILKRKEKTPKV